MATSPDRQLVTAFYRQQAGALLQYNPTTEAFQAAAWPKDLPRFQHLPIPMPIRVGHSLYLFSPSPDVQLILILVLNLDYIQREMLPQLVRKHVDGDYRVIVIDRSLAGSVVYPPGAALADSPPDDSVPLLGMPPHGAPMGLRQPVPPLGGPPDGRLPPPDGRPGPFQPGPWELEARHTAGGLDAAVAAGVRREMATNAVVFALLAASVVVLVVTTRAAQRLAAMQMEFVSAVSHELRTPLAVIGSAADNLAEGVVASEEQVRRYGGLIRSEGRRLTEMIEQVLSYSAMQSGRKKMERRPVEIAAVIDRAIAACAGQAEEARCQIVKQVAPGLPPVSADEASLIHAIANLLGNALKYGAPGHAVRIAARYEDGMVAVEVIDEGYGIDPSDLPHIFDAFYRGRSVGGGTIRGTGLGLNLVRRIAMAHGGTILVKSTLGEGSSFTLRLPPVQAPVQSPVEIEGAS
jgi:signal transduction histidine kinase